MADDAADFGAGVDAGEFGADATDFDLGDDAAAATGEVGAAADAAGAAAASGEESTQILYYHPETILDYASTVDPLIPLRVAPSVGEPEKDPHHKSMPFLSVYERTKILGTRANQLAEGAIPYISPLPPYLKDPLEIAKAELEARRLPFIVKRPMPDGTFEYWRLSDLMIL